MDMEVMAMKASSEFGRLETASASTRRKKVKKLKAIVGRKIVSSSKRRQKVKKQRAWRKKNCYGFDFGDSDFQLITSHLHGGDYDLKLYCRLGLYCYNFQKGTNFKFVHWKKYNTEFTCNLDYYITLEATDPACNSVFPFQILFSDAGCTTADTYDIDTWRILACRPRCNKPVDDYWDRDKFYTTEAREKLQAENAIFYISYKYRGVSSSGFAGDHKAITRKTMDVKPEHMSLEVAYELKEE